MKPVENAMSALPESYQRYAKPREDHIDEHARQLLAAIEDAMATPTVYRDPSPTPAIGSAPPVSQPGIPPMSARTTEVTRSIMYVSLATVPPGLVAVAVLVASEHANPTVIGVLCAAPAVLAVPVLALARLFSRVAAAAPDEHHHHYSGPVYQDQRNIDSKNYGLYVKNEYREGRD